MRGALGAALGSGGALGAFRSPHYRLFWFSSATASTGHHIRLFAQPYLVYQLTGSPFLLGLTSAFMALPTLILAFPAGALADRMDRRLLYMLAQGWAGVFSLALAVDIALGWVEVWHAWLYAFILGIYWAFERPARLATIPSLVADRRAVPSAIALYSILWNTARIVGPAIAGVAIALAENLWLPERSTAAPFFLSAAGFLAALPILARLPKMLPPPGRGRVSMTVEVREGLRFIGREPVFRTLIALSLFTGFFGMVYVRFLAVFADVHGVGPTQFGLMGSVMGIGSVLGGITVAFLGRQVQRGQFVLGSGVAFGLILASFAQAPSFVLALALLAVTGLTLNFFHVSLQTVLQMLVPDALRGRVMAIQSLNFDMLELGGTPLGATAERIGIRAAVSIWGLLVAGGVAAAAAVPQMRRLREQPSPEPV